MQYPLTIALLGALTTLAAAKTNQEKCQSINKNVVQAIQGFCSKTNLVVPSTYAAQGFHVGQWGPMDAIVRIHGSCSPAQWVPEKYCLSQFYEMCANSRNKGNNLNDYGKGLCQNWKIDVSNDHYGNDGY